MDTVLMNILNTGHFEWGLVFVIHGKMNRKNRNRMKQM